MTTVVSRSMARLPAVVFLALEDFDSHVRGVRDDVVHRRTLLRLRDDRLDFLLRRVRVDLEASP